MEKPRGSHGAFEATLAGRDKDSEKEKEKEGRMYICGERYLFSNCLYIIKSKRPPNWVPDKDV
jgi:hypothetical protein